MSFQDKVVVVTGATRGIGRAIASAFSAAGAVVIGTATTEAGAQDITEALQAIHPLSQGHVLNVTDAAGVEAFIKQVSDNPGAPTILVNNAAITRDNLLMRMKDSEWDDVIATNLTAVYRMTKLCLRGMLKAGFGRIINISSVSAMGNPGQANYAAAKAGVLGLTRSLALEIAQRPITVNAIAPGFIDTDMTRVLTDEQKSQILTMVPARRLGTPEEIAATAIFLASDGAAYITGQTLHVNGGMYLL